MKNTLGGSVNTKDCTCMVLLFRVVHCIDALAIHSVLKLFPSSSDLN